MLIVLYIKKNVDDEQAAASLNLGHCLRSGEDLGSNAVVRDFDRGVVAWLVECTQEAARNLASPSEPR
jgi:hypothetical protein